MLHFASAVCTRTDIVPALCAHLPTTGSLDQTPFLLNKRKLSSRNQRTGFINSSFICFNISRFQHLFCDIWACLVPGQSERRCESTTATTFIVSIYIRMTLWESHANAAKPFISVSSLHHRQIASEQITVLSPPLYLPETDLCQWSGPGRH